MKIYYDKMNVYINFAPVCSHNKNNISKFAQK